VPKVTIHFTVADEEALAGLLKHLSKLKTKKKVGLVTIYVELGEGAR